jgi:hypothetical protein
MISACITYSKAKGLDPNDKVLAKGIGNSLIHVLRMQKLRGTLTTQGKRQAAYVWALVPTKLDEGLFGTRGT